MRKRREKEGGVKKVVSVVEESVVEERGVEGRVGEDGVKAGSVGEVVNVGGDGVNGAKITDSTFYTTFLNNTFHLHHYYYWCSWMI